MELFNRRYLCFIAFAFAFSSLLCCFVSGAIKIAIAGVSIALVLVFLFVFIRSRRTKFYALFSTLLCLGVFLSSLSSYLFITRSENKADSLCGEAVVMVRILSLEDEGAYDTRLIRVGDQEVNIRAKLLINLEEDFEYGDELIIKANVIRYTDVFDRARLIAVLADVEDTGVYLNPAEEKDYFSIDGIRALCCSLRNAFGNFVDNAFDDYSGMVKGLLVNDKSDIDAKTDLDFRRSGTSHILAVSGTHIALLMGALELLLRKLSVKKEIRIALVSVFALFFLVLAAFAASAVRSVIMLYAVYLTYLLAEENDSITALFVSVALIILFSPFSVYDLGMWMSFLATLGILTVYPQFEKFMPYPKQKNLFARYSLRFLIGAAKAVMLTVVANFFLLPIMWYFFGAVSISSIPCNLILTPIVALLMPLCAVSTILSFVPYLGSALVWITKRLIDLMLAVVRLFSEARFGVVSLHFIFAGVLITLFSAVMIVLLIVKLKRKMLIFVPMLAFIIAFVSCFSVFSATAVPEIKYFKDGKSEFIFVNMGAECSVISVKGNYIYDEFYVVNNMSKYATEIDNYFILNPSKLDGHIVDRLLESVIIRNIYIPKNVNYNELMSFRNLFVCAEKYNINVKFYDTKEIVEICNGVSFCEISSGVSAIASSSAYVEISDEFIFYGRDGKRREIYRLDEISITLPL